MNYSGENHQSFSNAGNIPLSGGIFLIFPLVYFYLNDLILISFNPVFSANRKRSLEIPQQLLEDKRNALSRPIDIISSNRYIHSLTGQI